MSVSNAKELAKHFNHKIGITIYGRGSTPDTIAIECGTCNETLVDFDLVDFNHDDTDSEEERIIEEEDVFRCFCCGGPLELICPECRSNTE